MAERIIVGVVQARPIPFDRAGSLKKALALIEQAAKLGAQCVAFGEAWLPGYPTWLDSCSSAALWNHQPAREIFARLRESSVTVPGPETRTLGDAAADFGVVVVMGLNERIEGGPGNGTLYNSLLTFGVNGKRLNHHRKLVPTCAERLVWGPGDSAGLTAVDTTAGRVGGLTCSEHWMPLARQALHVSGELIHIAVCPTVDEMHQISSRHYAFEGGCFVLAAGLIMPAEDLPAELMVASDLRIHDEQFVLRGGSAIIGPDGQYIVAPVYDRETILIAEIDPAKIGRENMTLDVTGDSHRSDVFKLRVRFQ